MPGRHSPPPAGAMPATETLKGPKRKGTKEKRTEELQYLTDAGPGSPTLSTDSTHPPLPSKSAGDPTSPTVSSSETPGDATSVTTSPLSQKPTDKPHHPTAQDPSQGGPITIDGIEFHHASEAEFARLLNYYGIEWEYEPHQFPLQWHEGRPTEMFAPDFYLTEYDMYIELTTMRQSLVRRKNRKLRLLRALYPEISIKLLYRRDYHRLLERFGINPEHMEEA